jgi:ATP-dependent DNA helicase RecG
VKEKGKITNGEYQEINECSRATANRDLTELVQKNILIFNDISGAGANYELKIIAS